MKIYDYANREAEVAIPDKEILNIHVAIKSGDETGVITFVDGSVLCFDASNDRIYCYDDGDYVVSKSEVNDWMNFTFTKGRTFSYERQEKFS